MAVQLDRQGLRRELMPWNVRQHPAGVNINGASSGRTVFDHLGAVSRLLQQPPDHSLIDRIIFRHQNAA